MCPKSKDLGRRVLHIPFYVCVTVVRRIWYTHLVRDDQQNQIVPIDICPLDFRVHMKI